MRAIDDVKGKKTKNKENIQKNKKTEVKSKHSPTYGSIFSDPRFSVASVSHSAGGQIKRPFTFFPEPPKPYQCVRPRSKYMPAEHIRL